AIAEANTQATISFSDDISFEALNSNTGSFPVTLKNGTINITNETPVLDVYGAEAQPNEEVCLQVIARDMPPITGLQFELAWDKEKLQYNSIDTGEDILGLDVQTTSYAVTEDAFRLAWLEQSGQNIDLQPVQILFNLCFTALGEEGEYTVVDLGENVILEATTIFDNQPITFDVSFWGGGVAFVNNLANVYPGDTDRSREVNHYDLINIGLGYGQTGPTRENASLEYAPQPAEDWTSLTPITNVNYKHSDTNGDGKIDSEDTGAINQNWTSTPTLVNTIFTDQGVPFYVDSGVLNLLETNQLPIILGTEDRMAENIYSIAFSIYYEAEAMLEDGVIVTLENSWLGTEEELINVQRFFPEDKRIDVAISRIDQQGVTGFGELGALNIVMEDVILFQNEREVKFTIDHVQAIGEVQAESIGMSTQPSISQIQQASVATDNLLDRVIKVYPNPASTEITIATDGINVERLELHDIYGKHVSTIYKSNQLILNSFPTGIYFLTIHTNKGSTTKKINIR
ncbi:MAG: T9SS type A sorting domain-containing protein, partial [Bacteroidota bacterium]